MRTQLNKRPLYRGTDTEDKVNVILSIVAGGVSCILSILCVLMASLDGNILGIVLSSFIMIFMTAFYVLNSIYNCAAYSRIRRLFDILKENFALSVVLSAYMFITLCMVINNSTIMAWTVLAVEIALVIIISCYFSIGFKKYNFVSFIGKILMVCPILFLYSSIVSSYSMIVYFLFLVVMGFYAAAFALQFIQEGKRKVHTLSNIFFAAGTVTELLTILFFVF